MPKMKDLVAQKMQNFGETMKNILPSKKRLKEADLEILYNENRKGKARTPVRNRARPLPVLSRLNQLHGLAKHKVLPRILWREFS